MYIGRISVLCGGEKNALVMVEEGDSVPPFGMFIIKLPVMYRVVMVWCLLACRCNKKFTSVSLKRHSIDHSNVGYLWYF